MKISFTRTLKSFSKRQFSSLTANISLPKNEPNLHYLPGSSERKKLKNTLSKMFSECPEIPVVIGDKEYKSSELLSQSMPSLHNHSVCKYYTADESLIQKAIENSLKAKKEWNKVGFESKSAIFLKAAELFAQNRALLCASVMMGTGKNVWQAEIDTAAEAIDFLRFVPYLAQKIYQIQPPHQSPGIHNRMEYRPLEGFISAITPFNFNAIATNLPYSPTIFGNVSLWKPSNSSILSNYIAFKLLRQAGVPPGVVNFLPCKSGSDFGNTVFQSKHLAGVHFTGSTETYEKILRQVSSNTDKFSNFPRFVAETGGKNFHVVHASANIENTVNQSIRSAFEYSGQKCSAMSRMYVPESLWESKLRPRLIEEVNKIKVGQPDDFEVFVSAVINRQSYNRAKSYIDSARKNPDCSILVGGNCDDSKGFFVSPTIIQVKDPFCGLMKDELFAPIFAVYVYPDNEYEKILLTCTETSEYGLTGAIFAEDRAAINIAERILQYSAGNFYVNDKSTGAVVGQQPFGGSRKSGTNDKAGSMLNMARWVTGRAIKENYVPLSTWKYPHMN